MSYGFSAVASNGASASGTTLAVNYTVGASDTLVAVWIAYTGVVSSATLDDGGTHTYTNSSAGGTVASTLTHRMGTYYVLNPTPGTYTLTLTLGGSRANRRIAVATYSGVSAFQNGASQGQLAAATTTDAVSTSNITVTAQPALLTAVSFTANGTSTYTQGTGFSSRGNLANWDSIGSFSSLLEDIELTSTAAAPGTFTIGTSRDTLSSGLVFTEVVPTVSPSGIASTLSFGTASVDDRYPVQPTGIASTATFGTPTVAHVHTLTASGISSTLVFGTATFSLGDLSYSGVSSGNLNIGSGVSGPGVSLALSQGVVRYFNDS